MKNIFDCGACLLKHIRFFFWGGESPDIARKMRLNAEKVLFPKRMRGFDFGSFFRNALFGQGIVQTSGDRCRKSDLAEEKGLCCPDLREFVRRWQLLRISLKFSKETTSTICYGHLSTTQRSHLDSFFGPKSRKL